jgi:hypothetical protein
MVKDMDSNTALGKNVEIVAHNRPIKVAYIVPYEENDDNQWILDAVFYESYTRWGGARTLIIPASTSAFHHKEYEQWLAFYDADFVYSYVDMDQYL